MQQKILIGLILTLIIVVFIPVYWAMEPGRQEAARLRQQTEAAERGAKLYSSVCASCHGTRGEGIVGPALKSIQLDDKTLQKLISRGVLRTAMPAWGKEDGGPFHQQQITDLATFIKHWDSVPPAAVTPSHQTTPPVTETTAIDGAKLFATMCVSCHGTDGAGGISIGNVTPADIRWSNLGPKYHNDLALVRRSILDGQDQDNTPLDQIMPRWEGKLSDTQADAIIAHLQTLH